MSINNIEIWKERISECKASGPHVSEWCQKNGLTKAKYYYWYKIVNKSPVLTVENPVFSEVFVPVKDASSQGIKITCKDIEISLSDKNDITLAVQFIKELQEQC